MKKAFRIFCCCFCLSPLPVNAVNVPGLYEAETLVTDQSTESRKAATRACLRVVLVKLTGERNAPRKIVLAPLLNQAEKFVQQYRYKEVQTGTSRPDATPGTELRLVVRFDEETLNKSLRESGIPVWGRERPSILVWVVIERDNRRFFAGSDETPGLPGLLYQRAEQRGISIILPLMDLEDNAQIQPSDVWGNFKEPVLAASARYNPDVVLTARITSPMEGSWEGRWTAYRDDKAYNEWATEADLLEVAVEEGIDGVTDRLAAEFNRASVYTRLGDVELVVGDVNSVAQYAQVINYLKSLTSISQIHVTEVWTGKMKLTLTVHGGELAVVQAISLGSILEPVENIDGNYYRLVP